MISKSVRRVYLETHFWIINRLCPRVWHMKRISNNTSSSYVCARVRAHTHTHTHNKTRFLCSCFVDLPEIVLLIYDLHSPISISLECYQPLFKSVLFNRLFPYGRLCPKDIHLFYSHQELVVVYEEIAFDSHCWKAILI
jgi:hypothetical protein